MENGERLACGGERYYLVPLLAKHALALRAVGGVHAVERSLDVLRPQKYAERIIRGLDGLCFC